MQVVPDNETDILCIKKPEFAQQMGVARDPRVTPTKGEHCEPKYYGSD